MQEAPRGSRYAGVMLSFRPREWSGAVGDVAVLLPLFLAMDRTIDFPLERSFALAGLFYIWSGLYYGVPIPVQPLKAMAAAVLAQGLPFEVVRWAALLLALILLAGQPLADRISRAFPKPVVKGLQLGLGILLVRAGWRMLARGASVSAVVPASQGEAILWAVAFLVVPQLPLTLGNSVYATADAAREYFGERAGRVTPRALFADLGVVNLIAAAFGAYPLCHGSGGVTAHYAFGGRTGGTAVLAGAAYLGLALAGPRTTPLLAAIPNALLGVVLLYIGIRHAMLLRSLAGRYEWAAALAAGVAGGLTGNLAASLVIGWAAALLSSICGCGAQAE